MSKLLYLKVAHHILTEFSEMTVKKYSCIIVLVFEGYTVGLDTITSSFYLMLSYETGNRDFS